MDLIKIAEEAFATKDFLHSRVVTRSRGLPYQRVTKKRIQQYYRGVVILISNHESDKKRFTSS